MQARRIARELALLGLSQLPDVRRLENIDLEDLMLSAVRTLSVEAKEALESAADELNRSSNRLIDSQTRASDVDGARVMVEDAIANTQNAINRLGSAMELPEFIQMSNRQAVRAFALELLSNTVKNLQEIDAVLSKSMVGWNLKRIARIDRDILRLAVVEINYLGTPDRVAINESVELAKRYSGEEGYRFINGVLRRVVGRDRSGTADTQLPDAPNSESLLNAE